MERKITIQEEQVFLEDYQVKMLKENQVEGLLVMKGRGVDGISYFDYDVSGKLSMQALFEGHKMTSDELVLFLNQIKETIGNVREYLLDFHKLLLKPEYIFYEEERFSFCYFPYANMNFWEEFHSLTEYLVKVADFDDQLCGKMVMQLHTDTAKENYSFDKVIRSCLKLNSTKKKRNREGNLNMDPSAKELWIYEDAEEEEIDSLQGKGYDTYYHDQLVEAKGDNLLKEPDHFWLPMKGFLRRHRKKKHKWGDWEDLYES